MPVLSEQQITDFQRDGYILVHDAIGYDDLQLLRADFQQWVDESREHSANYGTTLDNRPRFSLQPGHSASKPALRRIASPNELSENYLRVMRSSPAVDAVCELFGPNLCFNNAKINSKLPGSSTEVKFHQDFPFELHSNDDLMTVLYFMDDVTLENGPLEVVPGSHGGPLLEHWHDGVFTGAVSDTVAAQLKQQMKPCTGPAGSACLMHTRLLHGSAPNRSDQPRTLFICSYNAEDAQPVSPNHIPSVHAGELIRGVETGNVRYSEYTVRAAELPKDASFFEQQSSAPDS